MRSFLILLSLVKLSYCLSWPSSYSVSGVLSLPYAEISEPFEAFVTPRRSRIDFYHGVNSVFSLSDVGRYGGLFKIVPETTEKLRNQLKCFALNGTEQAPVSAQTVLPDLANFQFSQNDIVKGQKCQKWKRVEMDGDKINTYSLWIDILSSRIEPNLKQAVPIRYEMRGYDSLLGSHYDHYYIDYKNFSASAPDASVFESYASHGKCTGFPGPGLSAWERVYLMQPLDEFVGNNVHVDKAFDDFRNRHNKEYEENEEKVRKELFRQNARFVHSRNRAGLTFTLALNHLADRTGAEIGGLRGKQYTAGYNGGSEFTYSSSHVQDMPSDLDWRLYGAVTPVKDQAVCGSCWSFGTTGHLEGSLFLQTKKLTSLSQQALIDCSWGFGNNGCDGGEDFRAYQFIMAHGGIPSESEYGSYLGIDGFCHLNKTTMHLKLPIKGYVNVTSGDVQALKVALNLHGPISISVDASPRSFTFYSHGVYDDTQCKSAPDQLDHSVLAVGYGNLNGKDYWLVKNSWSTYWGDDGYILIEQKDNRCGVTTSPTFVIPVNKP